MKFRNLQSIEFYTTDSGDEYRYVDNFGRLPEARWEKRTYVEQPVESYGCAIVPPYGWCWSPDIDADTLKELEEMRDFRMYRLGSSEP